MTVYVINHFNVYPWFFKYYFSFKLSMFYQQQENKRSSLIYFCNLFLPCIFKMIKSTATIFLIFKKKSKKSVKRSISSTIYSSLLLWKDTYFGQTEPALFIFFYISNSTLLRFKDFYQCERWREHYLFFLLIFLFLLAFKREKCIALALR